MCSAVLRGCYSLYKLLSLSVTRDLQWRSEVSVSPCWAYKGLNNQVSVCGCKKGHKPFLLLIHSWMLRSGYCLKKASIELFKTFLMWTWNLKVKWTILERDSWLFGLPQTFPGLQISTLWGGIQTKASKVTSFSLHISRFFHCQTCSLQTQQTLTRIRAMATDIYQILGSSLWRWRLHTSTFLTYAEEFPNTYKQTLMCKIGGIPL